MPNAYFPTRDDFKETIESSFEELLADKLPALIRRATEKKHYTIDEACEYLNCSRRHLQYLRNSGQINYIKNGKKIYFRQEDLMEFFDRNYIDQTN